MKKLHQVLSWGEVMKEPQAEEHPGHRENEPGKEVIATELQDSQGTRQGKKGLSPLFSGLSPFLSRKGCRRWDFTETVSPRFFTPLAGLQASFLSPIEYLRFSTDLTIVVRSVVLISASWQPQAGQDSGRDLLSGRGR